MNPLFEQNDRRIARALGVTPAGLQWLGKLVANPTKATKRGTEHLRLIRDGYAQWLPYPDRSGARLEVTESGRDLVRRARVMGW